MSAQPKKDGSQLVNAAQYLGYGLTWALSTGLFLVGGWFVDRWLGTMPLFLIAGAFIGAGAGFYSLYWHMVIEPRQKQEEGARELRSRERPDAEGRGADGRGGTGGGEGSA